MIQASFQKQLGRRYAQATSLPLLLAGASLFHLSLYSLTTDKPFPHYFLIIGIFVQALGISVFVAQLWQNDGIESNRNFASWFLLALSFSTALVRLSRFAGFSGFDFLGEVEVSRNTFHSGHWDSALGSISSYQSSLAITILPTMSSRVLNIPIDNALLFQTFTLTALIPSAVQALLTSLTGSFKLGTLSGVLLATNWFFFGAHIIAKSAAALFLVIVALYCLTKQERPIQAIGVLLGLGVAMSHYTIALLLVFMLGVLLAWSKIVTPVLRRSRWFTNMAVPWIGVAPVALTLALVALWLTYAAPRVLPDMKTAAEQALSSLPHFLSGPKRADTSLAITNSTGPIVTGWFNFQNGLVGLGALYGFNGLRKGAYPRILAGWVQAGIFLVGLLVAWIILPWLSLRVESTRILAMILPVIIFFLAIILTEAFRHPKTIWKIVAVAIIFLMLPMNLQLPSQDQNILYHQLDELPVAKRLGLESISIPSDSNRALATWVYGHLPLDEPVEVDAVGRYALITSSPFPTQVPFVYENSPPYEFHRYTVLSSYFVNSHLWSVASLGARVLSEADPTPFFGPSHDILYSSPKFWIVIPRQ